MTGYGLTKKSEATFDEVLTRLPEALKTEGFGVLTEIDLQRAFADKLGVPFRRYKILGACNPPFAHAALGAELEAGLVLPCNVVVYEDDEHRAVITAVDPTKTVAALGNPTLVELAATVKEKLTRALERVA